MIAALATWLAGSALGGLAQRFALPLAAGAGIALALAGALAWDRWIDDPAVARAAREGYVLRTERDAAEAELAEVRRQLDALKDARDWFLAELDGARRVMADRNEQTEQEIADHEAKLDAAGRSCRLDRADIDWLRR